MEISKNGEDNIAPYCSRFTVNLNASAITAKFIFCSEGKSESELIRSTHHKEDNLKQNPLQTESIVTKTEYKVNGINGNGYAHHIISNGGNDLTKKVCAIDEHRNGDAHFCTNI